MASDIYTLSGSPLWKRLFEGDSSAYSQIYNQIIQRPSRYGLLYISDRELVKDRIHGVFAKIYTDRAKLTPTDNIIAYLMVALKNTLFNALKKTSGSSSLDKVDEKENRFEGHLSIPETIYINKEQEKNTHMKVHTMTSSLATGQREVVYYRYIKDMSIDEISKIMDMSYQPVSNSIRRALGRVRNLFKREQERRIFSFFLPIKKILEIV